MQVRFLPGLPLAPATALRKLWLWDKRVLLGGLPVLLTDEHQQALLVNGFPVPIYFAGFQIAGFAADRADRCECRGWFWHGNLPVAQVSMGEMYRKFSELVSPVAYKRNEKGPTDIGPQCTAPEHAVPYFVTPCLDEPGLHRRRHGEKAKCSRGSCNLEKCYLPAI
jgi:hypothetical protein